MITHLQSTIHEALEHAPPEHLELALTALIEARFLPAILPAMSPEFDRLKDEMLAARDEYTEAMRVKGEALVAFVRTGHEDEGAVYISATHHEAATERRYRDAVERLLAVKPSSR